MLIRKYIAKDLTEMIRIWNAVVEEGIAFPQEETLGLSNGMDFSLHKATAQLRKIMKQLSAYISYTPTMSDDADTSAMQAMQ